MTKCNIRIVRAKVKNQPEVSGKFYLIKKGNNILFSAKNKSEANKKLKHAKENYC
jgi:hypothetical protein